MDSRAGSAAVQGALLGARGAPIGHLVGRVGCLTYGCCFGRRTHGSLSIIDSHPESKAVRVAGLDGVPLRPAAFYEAALDGVLFVTLNAVAIAGAPQGVPAALCLTDYGIGRFGIEFLRDNEVRLLATGLAVNQVVSLALAAIGALALLPLHLFAPATPLLAWGAVLHSAPTVLLALVPCAALVGLGFSLHRGRLGSWQENAAVHAADRIEALTAQGARRRIVGASRRP